MSGTPCPTHKVAPSSPRRPWLLGVAATLTAAVVFGIGVSSEPHFADESAFIAQSYFWTLRLRGDVHNPAWVEYPAFDLPPLPKYLIGLALDVGGFERRPGRLDALKWYQGHIDYRPETDAMLRAARWPSVLMGALGCGAVFALGTLALDWRVGLVAALLLMANPLYRLHARRAMADAPAEALILATAAVGLWTWRGTLSGRWRPWARVAGASGTGVLGGLAVLAKLNGGLGLMIVAAWTALAAGVAWRPPRRLVGLIAAFALSGGVAFATFVWLNPFLTAQPKTPLPPELARIVGVSIRDRTAAVLAHRTSVSKEAQGPDKFGSYALTTPLEKLKVVIVQGFGRFGLLGPADHDSTTPYARYDWSRDWGVLIWLPSVAAGAVRCARVGRWQARRAQPPTAWALLVMALVSFSTVTAYIPLAWDRYLLSIQPSSTLLVAALLVAAFDHLRRSPGHEA
jgi:hypothetical protein